MDSRTPTPKTLPLRPPGPAGRAVEAPSPARRRRALEGLEPPLPPGELTRRMKRYAYLFEGLTVRRVGSVTLICVVATACVVWFFLNTYLDLLVTALCVGYTSMVLFTIAGNLRQTRVPREVMQVLAIVAGSFIGTVLTGFVKGRDLTQMFTERLAGVTISMSLGIGFGCVVVAWYILREKHARDQARIHRAESERHQLEKNMLQARLQLMQAQVEPHFLFNTLANVQHLVETDPPAASVMLESLIQYLRAALPQMRESATNLGREVDMSRAFLEINRMRMGSRLKFHVDVPEAPARQALPADDADLARGERGQARRGSVLRRGLDHHSRLRCRRQAHDLRGRHGRGHPAEEGHGRRTLQHPRAPEDALRPVGAPGAAGEPPARRHRRDRNRR